MNDCAEIARPSHLPPLIPPGAYPATIKSVDTVHHPGFKKWNLEFECVVQRIGGAPVVLTRRYPVKAVRQMALLLFSVQPRSDLFREYADVMRQYLPAHELTVTDFKSMVGLKVMAVVRDVDKDARGRDLGQMNHYSTIDRLLFARPAL